ncbi:MAG: ATP-binding cassette domain-containing protein [Pseudomonadota bacterium]
MRVKVTYALCLAALVGLGFALPSYWVFLATTGIFISMHLTALGWVNGLGRMLALGPLAFAAISAWVVNHGVATFGLHPAWAVVAGVIAAAFFGLLVGLASMRLRGISLAVLTLSFALTAEMVINTVGYPAELTFTPVSRPDWLSGDRNWYFFSLAVLVALHVGLLALRDSRFGFSVIAMGQSERAGASLGVRIGQTKMQLVALSAAISGLAGAMLILHLGQVNTANFAPLYGLVLAVLALFVGGAHPLGALIGAVLAVGIPELLRTLGLPLDIEIILFALGALIALRSGETMAETLSRALRLPASGLIRKMPATDHLTAMPAANDGQGEALAITQIEVAYGTNTVLRDVSFTAEPGKVTALIGPNGAGKSTLIDAVTGFIDPVSGGVTLGARDVRDLSVSDRAGLGLRRTFQQNRAIDGLTPVEYMRLSSKGQMPIPACVALLKDLGDIPLDQPLHALDIGRQRLCEIAAHLASQLKVLMLDEPAAGFSEADTIHLADTLRKLAKRRNIAIVIIEHDLDFIRRAADQAFVINFGEVIASGTPQAVLADPQVQSAYLGQDIDTPEEAAHA